MNTIILSVRPEWLVKILNGEKTVEIRKSVPKLPCEVYLYCTKGEPHLAYNTNDKKWQSYQGDPRYDHYSGKVLAKFTLKEADTLYLYRAGKWFYANDPMPLVEEDYCKRANMSMKQMLEYGKKKRLYAWHITDLVIFEKPMELWQFNQQGYPQETDFVAYLNNEPRTYHCLTRAPQSWQYVEVKK